MSGSDILREVDEALRVEKAKRFWEENGKALIIFAAALVLGTAVQSAWTSYKHHQAEAATAQFVDAMKGQDPMAALKALSAEKDGSGSALAGLNAAGISLTNKDWKSAITLYQQVSETKSAPQTYKDLALIQMASLKLDHDEKITADDLSSIIAPVKSNADSVWNSRAVFLSAVIKAQKGHDFSGAREDLKALLSNETLPPNFMAQVKALDEVYKIKGEQK